MILFKRYSAQKYRQRKDDYYDSHYYGGKYILRMVVRYQISYSAYFQNIDNHTNKQYNNCKYGNDINPTFLFEIIKFSHTYYYTQIY